MVFFSTPPQSPEQHLQGEGGSPPRLDTPHPPLPVPENTPSNASPERRFTAAEKAKARRRAAHSPSASPVLSASVDPVVVHHIPASAPEPERCNLLLSDPEPQRTSAPAPKPETTNRRKMQGTFSSSSAATASAVSANQIAAPLSSSNQGRPPQVRAHQVEGQGPVDPQQQPAKKKKKQKQNKNKNKYKKYKNQNAAQPGGGEQSQQQA